MESPLRHPPLPEILAGRRVAVLGAGTVGQALGALLRDAGLPPVAVTCRRPENAAAAALVVGGQALTDNALAASMADLLLVTVCDDAISAVASEAASGIVPGTVAIHTCGALGLSALEPLRSAGAFVGSVHPLQSFASVQHAIRELPGSVFSVTADEDARAVAESVVTAVGGIPVPLAEEARPLYHAAAVLASNCFVALEDLAADLFVRAGFTPALAARALEPLVRGTFANIRHYGTETALTGPIVRGDIGTVRAHLAALEADAPEALPAYRSLGAHALLMARERGSLDQQAFDDLRTLLEGDGEARS